MIQYVQDYDEKYPPSRVDNFAINSYINSQAPWQAIIQPYVKSTQLFQCPSNTPTGTGKLSNTNSGLADTIPRSYACVGAWNNGNVTTNDWGGRTIMGPVGYSFASVDRPTSLSEVASSSQTIMVGEKSGDATTNQDPEFWTYAEHFHFQNHLGTTNFLFADGHVKAMKLGSTATPVNLWNITNTTNGTDANPGPANANLQALLNTAQAELNK